MTSDLFGSFFEPTDFDSQVSKLQISFDIKWLRNWNLNVSIILLDLKIQKNNIDFICVNFRKQIWYLKILYVYSTI